MSSANDFAILSPRERVAPENQLLLERLETLLPKLMTEQQLDMWLVIKRSAAKSLRRVLPPLKTSPGIYGSALASCSCPCGLCLTLPCNDQV